MSSSEIWKQWDQARERAQPSILEEIDIKTFTCSGSLAYENEGKLVCLEE